MPVRSGQGVAPIEVLLDRQYLALERLVPPAGFGRNERFQEYLLPVLTRIREG